MIFDTSNPEFTNSGCITPWDAARMGINPPNIVRVDRASGEISMAWLFHGRAPQQPKELHIGTSIPIGASESEVMSLIGDVRLTLSEAGLDPLTPTINYRSTKNT
jgi:hypothetical protein